MIEYIKKNDEGCRARPRTRVSTMNSRPRSAVFNCGRAARIPRNVLNCVSYTTINQPRNTIIVNYKIQSVALTRFIARKHLSRGNVDISSIGAVSCCSTSITTSLYSSDISKVHNNSGFIIHSQHYA